MFVDEYEIMKLYNVPIVEGRTTDENPVANAVLIPSVALGA